MSFVPQYPAPPAPPPVPATVDFTGNRKDFFRLAAKGAGLELITAGFYRFWLTTDIRRHLWSNTSIDGDAAEYTGRGKELLIGFLVAMAILMPIYVGYFLISVEAERFKGFASVPLFLLFYAFGQFAIYRARRYRLTRTIWRGVRFWMDGSGWSYAWRSVLWGFLVGVTLGLAMPWREAALERYKMRHTYYGNLQGDFEGKPTEFLKRAWGLWLAMPFAFILFPLLPFVFAMYKAIEWRWWLSGLRIGDVRVESALPRNAFIGLYWKVIGWYVLASVVLGIYFAGVAGVAAVLGGGFGQPGAPVDFVKNIPLIAMSALGYLGLILTLNVLIRLYLTRDMWALISRHIQVHNLSSATDVVAKGELVNALGEGFADGLDVAGF